MMLTEEYKRDLLAALGTVRETLTSGRTELAADQLDALLAHVRAKHVLNEGRLTLWFKQKYVQRADSRQQALGLSYTTAETQDLARAVLKFVEM